MLPVDAVFSSPGWPTVSPSNLPSFGLLRHAASVLFEYKASDNNLLFDGIPVTDNLTEILRMSALSSGGIMDAGGSNTFGLTVTASPGDLTARNKSPYFRISRSGSRAHHLCGTLDMARTLPLPGEIYLQLSGRLQLADGISWAASRWNWGSAFPWPATSR
jgi:hypothetical protein